MAETVKRRRYDSPRRRDGALATRRAVLDAAQAQFLERGYVSTSIEAIAGAANVSPLTIYAAFGTKRSLLAELVDRSISGDGAPPILEQAWVQEMRDEPEARRRLAILARNGAAILERRAALDEVVRGAAAADPEIAGLWERGKAQRLTGQRALIVIVAAGKGGLRTGLGVAPAADTLYAIGSPEAFRLLVVDRGWSAARFERWYAETLARLLLDEVER